MISFINSNVTLNLTDKQVTIAEDNHWFTDTFLVKISFPVELALTPELDRALGLISDYNSASINTIMEGMFYINNKEYIATAEVERIEQNVSLLFKIGYEDLPNFNTKLAEIPMLDVELDNETMAQHAAGILDLSYPETNYVFAQIHINTLSGAQWEFFEGRLNARDQGSFLVNEYDVNNDVQVNRNVMQPLPALHYVIKQGFADLGFTVSGGFFDVSAFAKAYLFHLSDYYTSFNPANQEFVYRLSDPNTGSSPEANSYEVFSPVLENGIYVVNGVVSAQEYGGYEMWQGGRIISQGGRNTALAPPHSFYIDEQITVTGSNNNRLRLQAVMKPFFEDILGNRDYDAIFLDVTITQVAKQNASGDLISTLIEPTRINLSKCVPDITFGDLLTAIKKMIGIDVYQISPTEYRIDVVKDMIKTLDIIDLSSYEVRYPRRSFRKGDVHILNTPASVDDVYMQQSLYIDKDGASTYTSQEKDSDTQEVNTDIVALELRLLDGVNTAHQAGNDRSQIALIRYDGLQNGRNWCAEFGFDLYAAYDEYLSEIYDYKINGKPIQWTFTAQDITVEKLNSRARVFVFGNIHLVEKIQRTHLGDGFVQVRLDLVTLV
jgi:hypothetical protein